ncbi:hypothetical protein CsSME_00031074 [Camellia sinensis var. sinensis]
MRFSSAGFTQQSPEGEKGCLNSELWHACAGPLVSLHAVGSRVVYFPQGHSEQVGLVAGLKLPITLDKLYYIVIDFTSLYCCNGLGCFCFNFHQGDNVPPYLTSFELWVFLQSFFERCNIYFKNYIFRLSRRDHFSQSLLRRMFSQGIEAGIAVIGHVGLTPQAISVLGGFRAQGKNIGSAVKVVEFALALQEAGCFSVVLKCVLIPVAAAATSALRILTIGIGAGTFCSGQVN